MKGRLGLILWCAALVLAAGLLLKHFVFDIYHVDSASMEPTIMGTRPGGEHVLVHYGAFQPTRFDPVVVLRGGDPTPIVKRACALENERVQIVGGDLLIDGRRLSFSVPRPAPIEVLDERSSMLSKVFFAEPEGALVPSGTGWMLNAAPGSPARLLLREDVHDDYIDVERGLVRGHQSVNDLLLDVQFELSVGARAGFELTELGDLFRVTLQRGTEGYELELEREGLGSLGRLKVAQAQRLCFANLDDSLYVRLDQGEALLVTYAENRLDPRDLNAEGKHLPPRVRIWCQDGSLRLDRLRLARDLYYTERGEHAQRGALRLGLGECFLLGDNSASSRDGREWGPTPLSEILGRPTRVVWPLSRWRELAPAQSPEAWFR